MSAADTSRRVLVTGGAGFIGSALCRHLVGAGYNVVNVDKLTYAGRRETVGDLEANERYRFIRGDVCDQAAMLEILHEHGIGRIMHLAVESHVDRSIASPEVFLQTNVVGTFRLLGAALAYWRDLKPAEQADFRFHHVSTDEVFGDLPLEGGVFDECSPYAPSSPYAASKAASDHFVRAWHRTYGLPVVVSNCSNNYGPFQYPEKLIPLTILNALEGVPLPVYGRGSNVRDWLFVDDHVRALELVMTRGRVGETYAIGGRAERSNLEVVEAICDALDSLRPLPGGGSRRGLITFVQDRPGHDRRYAVNPLKTERELGWNAEQPFEQGLLRTVEWYLANEWWWRPLREAVR